MLIMSSTFQDISRLEINPIKFRISDKHEEVHISPSTVIKFLGSLWTPQT